MLLVLLFLTTSCAQQPTPTPTPVATPLPVIGLNAGDTATASGKVAPARAADLSFTVAGRVQNVAVAVGDHVAAETLLLALDDTAATAAVAQAQAGLAKAQAQLAELQAGPPPQEISAAQAQLAAAEAQLAQLTEAARPEEVAAARAELAAVQARLESLYAEPSAAVVAAARAAVQQAQAALDRLLHPATASQIAGAQAQVQSAQAELDLLTAGARATAIASAQADVAAAEAMLQRSAAELASTQLRAPFTGTVTALMVSQGEMVQIGEVVLTLADLSRMQVETTDLSERAVVNVTLGQPVVVFIEPLNREISGRVAQIAPQATVIGGDVVYSVLVDLAEQPPNLRWGMSAEVAITKASAGQ